MREKVCPECKICLEQSEETCPICGEILDITNIDPPLEKTKSDSANKDNSQRPQLFFKRIGHHK